MANPVDAFVLPTVVVAKANAGNPAKSRLVATGIFDTGPAPVDLGAAATLTVGAITAAAAAPQGKSLKY